MKIHDLRQGSSEWFAMRAGRPTASEFDNLVTPTFKPRTGQTPESYLYLKVAEASMGMPVMGGGGSFNMEQGSLMENEAIPYLSFTYDLPIERVGFCTTDDGRVGCSPDGLIGEDGGIELKCPAPHTHVKYLLNNVLPPEYAAQVHGSMFVTGRPWWMFCSYSRQFPPLILKVERDEKIQEALREALDEFLARFDEALATIRKMKQDNLSRNESRASTP